MSSTVAFAAIAVQTVHSLVSLAKKASAQQAGWRRQAPMVHRSLACPPSPFPFLFLFPYPQQFNLTTPAIRISMSGRGLLSSRLTHGVHIDFRSLRHHQINTVCQLCTLHAVALYSSCLGILTQRLQTTAPVSLKRGT